MVPTDTNGHPVRKYRDSSGFTSVIRGGGAINHGSGKLEEV